MFDEIDVVFNIKDKEVIFAWGNTIYNPSGFDISPELMVHETVHGARQLGDIEGWWQKYLNDSGFRMFEEILAHRSEYLYVMEHGNRQQRRRALKIISDRLSGPLYNRMISNAHARSLIKGDTS